MLNKPGNQTLADGSLAPCVGKADKKLCRGHVLLNGLAHEQLSCVETQ